jgi:hypothetical protein
MVKAEEGTRDDKYKHTRERYNWWKQEGRKV